ncbi:anthranilate synthase component 1 [Planctobacterium marinum]|uniref:anthranilate synthase component 1 n=1 Tax=Planctobacterium marinum TaxID=1631968 RepID=UPI001E57D0EA|nr:anthranilate synthase component 1 [Planctobacterium marinum]MCC2605579.1 anthranilate synthase component 1 [Planctobacterium marinum]
MSLAELSEQPGKVATIESECPYIHDPLDTFISLCAKQSNCMLLESAEIDSKNSTNSLIMVDAAVKLTCQGNRVSVEVLSDNGVPVLSFLHNQLLLLQGANCTLDNRVLNVAFSGTESILDEDARLKSASVFDVLRILQRQLEALSSHPMAIFVGGTFAYDLLATFENLPKVDEGDNDCPDYVFYLAETLITIDHQQQTSRILGSVFSGEQVAQSYFQLSQRIEFLKQQLQSSTTAESDEQISQIDNTLRVNQSDEVYCQHVRNLKENILVGDIFQVVPSRTFSLHCPSPYLAYRKLKQSNPSPYMFYIQDSDFVIFGASPESALKYQKDNNVVEVYPIAGTRPRGKREDGSIDYDLDSRIELTLREDDKEKSEHLMLVDLARNDIARVSTPGTRHVKDLLKVDRYSHVMHLVSRVVGQLREDLDCLHAYQACMNMGTLVGAPKVKAATLIREVEQKRRGSYGGAVGYINGHGDMDTCIVIRSAYVKNQTAYVQAGAGVVYDSDPQSEADETRGKAQAVISAIQQANQSLTVEG